MVTSTSFTHACVKLGAAHWKHQGESTSSERPVHAKASISMGFDGFRFQVVKHADNDTDPNVDDDETGIRGGSGLCFCNACDHDAPHEERHSSCIMHHALA